MRKRKKYEPAGGVVPMQWKRGPADPDTLRIHSGRILVEVWRVTIDEDWATQPKAYVTTRARLAVATRDADGTLLLNGSRYDHNAEVIRRHCVFHYPVTTRRTLTLGDWPEATHDA